MLILFCHRCGGTQRTVRYETETRGERRYQSKSRKNVETKIRQQQYTLDRDVEMLLFLKHKTKGFLKQTLNN